MLPRENGHILMEQSSESVQTSCWVSVAYLFDESEDFLYRLAVRFELLTDRSVANVEAVDAAVGCGESVIPSSHGCDARQC